MDHLERLIEHFERGEVLPILGPGIFDGTAWATKALVASLAERSGYPPDEPMVLDLVAQYSAKISTPGAVKGQVLNYYKDAAPIRAHNHLLDVFEAVPETERPRQIISLCFDDVLERVAADRRYPVKSVFRGRQIVHTTTRELSVFHVLGCLHDVASLAVTTEEREDLLEQKESVYFSCRGSLAQRTWLCLGTDLNDRWLQRVYREVLKLGGDGQDVRPVYTCSVSLTATAAAWWGPNLRVLDGIPETLLEVLNRKLRYRAVGRIKSVTQDQNVASEQQPLERPLFKQLLPYQPEDKDIFFGRDFETQFIAQQVLANRLTVVTGPSGAGKSSLLNAGVVPLLLREGLTVVRTRVLGSAGSLLVTDDIRPIPGDHADAQMQMPLKPWLTQIACEPGHSVVLIIDQFEELFTKSISASARQALLTDLERTISDPALPLLTVLSLRSDWIHQLHQLDERIGRVPRYEARVNPLTAEQARLAITGPLASRKLPYDESLVEEILEDLGQQGRRSETVTQGVSSTISIEPTHLSLVCDALIASSEQLGFTRDAYLKIGRAEGVLGRYLDNKLLALGDDINLGRRILEVSTTPWGTRATRSLNQIAAQLNVTSETLQPLLGHLVNDRLLRRDVREGTEYYELTHDYLAAQLELTEEMRSLKRAEHWLEQGADEWSKSKTLLGRDQFRAINAERDRLRLPLHDAERELMLRCALVYDIGVDYWLGQISEAADQRTVLMEVLRKSEDADVRRRAAEALGPRRDSAIESLLLETTLGDPTAEVRRAAAGSLAGCSQDTRQTLIQTSSHGSTTDQIRAIEALGLAGVDDVIPFLMGIAAERDVTRRRAAIKSLDLLNPGITLHWFWLRYRERWLSGMGLLLAALLVVAVSLHFLVIFGFGQGTAWLTTPISRWLLRCPLLLSYQLQWQLILPLTVLALIWVWIARTRFAAVSWQYSAALTTVITLFGILNGLYRPMEQWVARTRTAQVYNRAEYEIVNTNNIETARRLFQDIYLVDSKEKVLIESWLAGISYLEDDYLGALRQACQWLAYDKSIIPDYGAVADSLITTVHWSLYQLAQGMPLDQALALRSQVAAEIGQSAPNSRCLTEGELSPYFLGISPAARAYMIELPEKYAPLPLYEYLGRLTGGDAAYAPPPGAAISQVDQQTLGKLLAMPTSQLYPSDNTSKDRVRYQRWAAFLTRQYDHPAFLWYWPDRQPLLSAAALAYALQNAGTDPAADIARIEAVMDSSHPYAEALLANASPWLDDLYALLMYLWNRLGDTDHVLEYYARLSEVEEQNLVCRFCIPVNVIGTDMPLAELEALVRNDDSRIREAACHSPYLLDLLGLRQLAGGYYDDARATFQQLRDVCGSAYPNLEPNDYLRVTSAFQSIAEEPSKANYQAYFALMDGSWTWNGEGDMPGSVTWFLQASVARTNVWPAKVFVEANPWVMYAKKLEEYEAAFAADAQTDVRIPAALLQAAWVYDVLSGYPNEALDKPSRSEFARQLRGMAAENLRTYLRKYWRRTDIPPEFCRYYRPTAARLPTYNATQDCVMEWLALIHIGGNQEAPVAQRLEEDDVVAMQDEARRLVEFYPQHHLANNLLNWAAWGYCYRANLYDTYSAAYIENYRKALETYQELMAKYPRGAMAENAAENVTLIEEKLRSPERRRLVPEGRWTWDTVEKPTPRLSDLLELLRRRISEVVP